MEWAIQSLRDGGIGAFPTETVYGLAGDARREAVVEKIFAAKNRPYTDPLIVHVGSMEAARLVADFSPLARALANHFWPGPLTLILPKSSVIPGLVTAGKNTVAVRWPLHPVAQSILKNGELVLAAPSANAFGRVSPTRPKHVLKDLEGRIDFVLDGGPTGWGLESTVLDVSENRKWRLYRPGPVSAEELQAWVQAHAPGTAIEAFGIATSPEHSQPSPGLLPRHYSPDTPLKLVSDEEVPEVIESLEKGTQGFLLLTGVGPNAEFSGANLQSLSSDGTLESAARNLYALLHQLDRGGISLIYVQRFPETGLGVALNNRLERAARR